MSDFYNDFELQEVLQKLQSSAHIEEKLKADYQEETFQREEYKSYKKKRPLLVKELYLLILEIGDLPSLQQFQRYYDSKHPIKKRMYFSEMTALKKGYRSLVRDLHFYFLLRESELFDEVKTSYLFDLQAKTDLLLRKGEKKLGLQLFNGGKNLKTVKQEKAKKSVGQTNYELIYFGTQYKGNRKILTTTLGATFVLYSEEDVQTIYELLEKSKTVESLIDEAQCEQFDDFIESVPLKIYIKLPNYLAVKHSILEIGERTNEEITQFKKYWSQHGITYYYYKYEGLDHVIRIIDGKDFDQYEYLLDDRHQILFNVEQYKIEHALIDLDISVLAGAGSGKTFTLVSRTLYLLNMGIIKHVYEIAMITFTNEAANNILESLEKRFLQMFKQTNNKRFLTYLDELCEMKIMTIPAFAKHILFDYGHQIGIGQNFAISQLTTKKNELIDAELHNVYTTQNIPEQTLAGIEFYQITEFAKAFAEKVEQKGLFAEQLLESVNPNNPFEPLVINTLVQVEQELKNYKQERDVLGLSDLTRYLRLLLANDVSMKNFGTKVKYLFVDEFQDSDRMQIDFIAKLAAKASIRLLVVGDIKQGIYRFRGANVTAFELLQRHLEEENRSVTYMYLNKNYRTEARLLNTLENIFEKWKENGYLPSSERLIATKPENTTGISYIECHNKVSANAIITLFNEMSERPRENPSEVRVLVILVRTNGKVTDIHQLLSNSCAEKNIPLQIVKDGTLFKSRAAKDLLALLYAWLLPEDKIALFELAQTAFSKPFTLPTLEKNSRYEMADIQFELPTTWQEASKQFKLAPGLTMLNEFLQNTPYAEHLVAQGESEQTIQQYILNMHKILTLMTNGVANDQVDLFSLYNWLKIEVLTNVRDDEAELNDTDYGQDYIKVMTVHKSKGLEFDTVVIPYVNDAFYYPNPRKLEILVEADDEHVQYGWHYAPSGTFRNVTQNFHAMRGKEKPHIIEEETKNLYVALTRAKERLAIFDAANVVSDYQAKQPNTWLHLIKGGRNDEITTCFNLCKCRSTI